MNEHKAVISGNSGFIAQNLLMDLKSQGITVIPIPRELLFSPIDLQKFFQEHQPDYIYHLAAYGNHSNQDDISMTLLANIVGTMNMLQASLDVPYKSFINVSSSSVGLSYETFYSASKAATERIVKAFVNKFDKPIVNFRPYSVYGEGEADFRFIPTVFKACLQGSGMQLAPDGKHDWVYVGDVVDALIRASEYADKDRGQIIECGTGVGVTNYQIVKLIQEITGKKIKDIEEIASRPYDNANWYADYTDSNKMQIKEGLEKIYPYYKKKYEI